MSIADVLSIQLYTMRALGDLDRILDAVADAGYCRVETVGSQLDDAAATRSELDARGLKVSSSHVSLAALRGRPEALVEACRTLGCDQLFMPAVPPHRRAMAAAGWRALGRELGEVAERLHGHGIELGYHNHHWELAPKEGEKTALELLFEGAAGSPLTWQADVAWLVRGGVEPKAWLQRYRSRLTSAHVKDIAPAGQNLDEDGWADVGSGTLDWRDLWRACRAAGARWMVVEHDKPKDPARTAQRSFAFLTEREPDPAMDVTTVGIVGCGNISDAYLEGAARSELIRVKSCADLQADAAQAKAAEYGISAVPVDALLADPEIEIVLNLTVPLAHGPVSRQIVTAGKHVYSEKPLAARFSEGQALMLAAAGCGVRVGCAPDTFLGAAHQACRRALDAGRIGRPIAGAAAVLSHGMEHWHPNPEFFFKRGGGPIHDVGPYYVTQLVNLLGPVSRVAAQGSTGSPTRTVTSASRHGQVIEVEVPTTVNGVLSFASGANVALSASWDVWKHRRLPFEVYGTEGSLIVPDPNFFGGTPQISERDADWQELDISAHPFRTPNRTLRSGAEVADYRIIGLLEMAAALRQGRAHRASGDLALHVLEVLDAFERSSVEGRHVMIATPCEQPEPLPLGAGEEVFLE